MTDPDEEPSWEEALYALLKRYGFMIAVFAPLIFVSVVPVGSAAPLIILVTYLGEAILYTAMLRMRRVDGPPDVLRWPGGVGSDRRVGGAPQEPASIVVGRIGGKLARALATTVAVFGGIAVVQAIGLPLAIAILVGLFVTVAFVWWIVARSLR